MGTLVEKRGDEAAVAGAIDAACRELGFFSVVGHGIDSRLVERVDAFAREFFALPEEEKRSIEMARGGRAWRGWFPLGGELTSGRPDRKEGIYFGAELDPTDPRVADGRPLHGPNLFPPRPVGFREAVLEYMSALTDLGHGLARGVALALGIDPTWFREHVTDDPVVLFRIFRYPPDLQRGNESWGVAEHTDYGLLTLLHQDGPGLEVRSGDRWLAVPPVDDAFVCNLGDMLELMSGGRYRSTPHRVRNESGRDRLSLPFFFDPSWDARVRPLPGTPADPVPRDRWDARDLFAFRGTYGEYLVDKVARVFPDLGRPSR